MFPFRLKKQTKQKSKSPHFKSMTCFLSNKDTAQPAGPRLQNALPQSLTSRRLGLTLPCCCCCCCCWSVPGLKVQKNLAESFHPVQPFLLGVGWKPAPGTSSIDQHGRVRDWAVLKLCGQPVQREWRTPDLGSFYVTRNFGIEPKPDSFREAVSVARPLAEAQLVSEPTSLQQNNGVRNDSWKEFGFINHQN